MFPVFILACADYDLTDNHYAECYERYPQTDPECEYRMGGCRYMHHFADTVDDERRYDVADGIHRCEPCQCEGEGHAGRGHRQPVIVVRLGYAVEVGGNQDTDTYYHGFV